MTVENKKHGLPCISTLQNIPAALRFVSAEPLLEDVGLLDLKGINWVIAGGESGPKPRAMSLSWAENIRSQCEAQLIAFFFKQVGGSGKDKGDDLLHGREYKHVPVSRKFINQLIPCKEIEHDP